MQPTLYYIRHGETDWNVAGRLQGRRDIPLNATGREQASHCGEVLRGLFARDGIDAHALDYISSPLGRARATMDLVRAKLGLEPGSVRIEPELAEISFGAWEGFTIAELRQRDPQQMAAREHDKWRFLPPGGESYEAMAGRIGAWYRTLTRDAVVTAHGGTARGLMAYLGLAQPAAAPLVDIAQGVIYVFAGAVLTRYA
jgi:broad specificity phosphatase PhoE